MLVIHKLLPLIVSPLGLVIGLWLLALVFRRTLLAWLGLAGLLICALPATGTYVWKTLEADYHYQPIAAVEDADAVVVLSGMLGRFEYQGEAVTEWNENVDRLFAGVALCNAGRNRCTGIRQKTDEQRSKL